MGGSFWWENKHLAQPLSGRPLLQQQHAHASQRMADNYALATDIICIHLHVFAYTPLFLSHRILSHIVGGGLIKLNRSLLSEVAGDVQRRTFRKISHWQLHSNQYRWLKLTSLLVHYIKIKILLDTRSVNSRLSTVNHSHTFAQNNLICHSA